MAIKWKIDEMDFIRKHAKEISAKEIAKQLRRSIGSVYQKSHKLKVCLRKDYWQNEEIEFLRNNYEKIGINKTSKVLNRSYYSIHKKALRLNLNYKHKSWKEEPEFVFENENSIVEYKDIIRTFDKNERTLAVKYIEAKKMRKQGILLKNIAKRLGIPYQTVRNWSSKDRPRAIHCINRLTKLGLLPLIPENTQKFISFLKIFAWIFGDGHISNRFSQITLAGNKATIELFAQEIKETDSSFKIDVKTKKTEGVYRGRKIKGACTYLTINDSPFSRLLYAAGAPKGNKVIQPFKLPEWIFTLDKKSKSTFLGALWSTDGSKPIWSKRGFYLCFQMNKSIKFKNEHEVFLNSIKTLFETLGIKTSTIKWNGSLYERKDGAITDKAYFYVSTSATNFLKFYENIPIFDLRKRIEFERTYLIIKERLKNVEKRRLLFVKAKQLSANGLSLNDVSKELKLPYSTVKTWIRGLYKPI